MHTMFETFPAKDLATLHHALRMVAKYPSEAEHATTLADEIWSEICRRAEQRVAA